MLSVLPVEIRFQIFPYVFSTEDEGLIVVRATRRGDWASDMGLPPYARLLQDPQYHHYRRRRSARNTWPGSVEEAFHKALRWTAAYQHRLNGSHRSLTDVMVSKAIYDFTGQWRNRKQISSHIQHLKRMSSRMPEASDRLAQQIRRDAVKLWEADRDDIANANQILEILGQIQNATFVLARRIQEKEYAAFALSQGRRRQSRQKIQAPPKPQIRPETIMLDGAAHSLFHEAFNIDSQDVHELSLKPIRMLGTNFLALSSVNHLLRTEFLQYIASQLSFDFTHDHETLRSFCTLVNPIHRQHVRHIAIEFVDGHTRDMFSPSTTLGRYLSTNLPNLKTISLTLIPRNHTNFEIRNYWLFDHHWGQQTKEFLSSLGDFTATIILSLRWEEDCDYFEENYVGSRGWKCIRRSGDQPRYVPESVPYSPA